MSLEKLYSDFNVDTAEPGDRHYRDGWINAVCPHCTSHASPGHHLGYNVHNNYFSCFHCGGVSLEYTLSKILNLHMSQVRVLVKEYSIKTSRGNVKKNRLEGISTKPLELPSYTLPLTSRHKRYLKERGFRPTQLIKKWKLLSTGPFSKLDNTIYKFRIVIPIYWNNILVSFQTRDYTGKNDKLRYIACTKEREKIHHKHIVYGLNLPKKKGGRIIVVEGVVDAWRFRGYAVATFGIAYTVEQVSILRKSFDELIIMFDPDANAQIQARQLQIDLISRGCKATIVKLKKDPGELSQKEADNILKDLDFI